jgi:tetratricopeptide (TPR) repeat protein
MKRFTLLLLTVSIFISCKKVKEKTTEITGCYAPKLADLEWYTSGKQAPLIPGLEGIDFKITTTNPKVQEYFNQGMMLAYGFNHAEAARSFFEATRIDTTCAMAHWGYAYVLGPNYNGGMEADHYQRAYEAISKARSLSNRVTPLEEALIEAMATRYQAQPPADRTPLDEAYAAAMKKIHDQYPSHPDIGAMYAESLMNLHPWDLYAKGSKEPKEWTPKVISVLEGLLKNHSKHPGAHHFYIHAMEASSTPEKALTSAHILDTLVSGSGHLLHMPSHIYINTGDYHLGTLSNQKAIEADSGYTTACHAQGVYPLAYFPHNYHFMAATATLEGNSKLAWTAAKKMQEHTATAIMDQPGWGTLQHYYIIPYYIAVKFGMWDEILSFPEPVKNLAYPKSIWHYARGMAYLGKNKLSLAEKEYDAMNKLAAHSTLQNVTIWEINTATDLVQIANKVLSAGIAQKKGDTNTAIQLLQSAADMEDQLNYNEPPDWFFSVRHDLGSVLIQSKKYSQAEKEYRKDLQTWKKNGWALMGLYQAMKYQNKNTEAEAVLSQFNRAWQFADVKISSSSNSFN